MRSEAKPPLLTRAAGRWRSILPQLGVPAQFLNGRHQPCPCCGGKDRARWTDLGGNGCWICNQCGAGTGVELVMRLHGWDFKTAATAIEKLLPDSIVTLKKAQRQSGDLVLRLWRQSHPLDGRDPASVYLARRGLEGVRSPSLRFRPAAPYREDGQRSVTSHPALVALFQAPDKVGLTAQQTYLTPDGAKASVAQPRKLAPCPVPRGGAVRLMPPAETMGIAEGVETALSAARLFEVPVWAALSALSLTHWEPPEVARAIFVFGDRDASFTGQWAAYELAKRLRAQGRHVEVRLPDLEGDWNDVLQSQRESA